MHLQTSLILGLAASLSTMVAADVVVGWASNGDCSPYTKSAEGPLTVDTCYGIQGGAPNSVIATGLPDGQSVQFYSGSSCSSNDDLQLVIEANSQGCVPTDGEGITQFKLVNQS